MKRKAPKNQRPYASPSGKKARMVEVTGEEFETILAQHNNGSLAFPYIVAGAPGSYYVNADELRKWRASQTTSESEST